MSMTAQDFVAKWRRVDLSERSAVQQHFLDLCALVGHPPGASEADLKKRTLTTLTNFYNQRPTWLDNAHRRLDEAVFAAYGWPPDLSDDKILARLLALNLERATATRQPLQNENAVPESVEDE
jgi:hypothetical protein